MEHPEHLYRYSGRLQNIMVEYMVLDIETQRWAEEIPGGWDNIPGFGLAVAVTMNSTGTWAWWLEEDVSGLICHLTHANKIITFNGINFDYEVLRPYGLEPETLYPQSFDILREMEKELGHRVSLESVAQATLGRGKIGSGIEAVQDYQAGLIGRVIEYCKGDVEITQQIYEFIKKEGFIYYRNLRGGILKCKLTAETEQ